MMRTLAPLATSICTSFDIVVVLPVMKNAVSGFRVRETKKMMPNNLQGHLEEITSSILIESFKPNIVEPC